MQYVNVFTHCVYEYILFQQMSWIDSKNACTKKHADSPMSSLELSRAASSRTVCARACSQESLRPEAPQRPTMRIATCSVHLLRLLAWKCGNNYLLLHNWTPQNTHASRWRIYNMLFPFVFFRDAISNLCLLYQQWRNIFERWWTKPLKTSKFEPPATPPQKIATRIPSILHWRNSVSILQNRKTSITQRTNNEFRQYYIDGKFR